MKPTFENNRLGRQNGDSRPFQPQISKSPVTAWSFQASALEMRGGSAPFQPGAQHPGFHTLSQEFLVEESRRESRLEGALFGLMTVLSLWPIALAAHAAFALVR